MNQPDDQKQPGDFAKIVRGTSGQQVLFFLENSVDDANTLHCVAAYDGIHADMKLGGLPDEAFKTALDKADVVMADKVLAQMAELGLTGVAFQGA